MANKTDEPNARRSGQTRQRLLRAAAELIAELGWGRVTTRAIAQRAGLPHGAVSYHFAGREQLLTEAALDTIERMAPVDQIESLESVSELVVRIAGWVADATDGVPARVLMESLRESERSVVLRDRLAGALRAYRRSVAELARADQRDGAAPSGVRASALATLIVAAGDGLLLHALLDSELDVREASGALSALLRAGGRGGR